MNGPKVRCNVDTCTHYVNGDLCGAAKIDILNELPARMSQNDEQTECKTFEKRRGLANMLGSMDNVNWGGMVSDALFEGDDQMNPSVTCIVDSCRYWEQGDRCVAEEISVAGRGADECQDTDCNTFAPRDKNHGDR